MERGKEICKRGKGRKWEEEVAAALGNGDGALQWWLMTDGNIGGERETLGRK